MTPQERAIAAAQAQVGYMGKRSDAQLDDFRANTAGRWNKYARDLDALGGFYNGRKNGYDWCDVFVDWVFVSAFGRELGQKLLCQPDKSLGAGTKYSMNYYRQRGQFHSSPQPGDQIFFGDSKSVWHTGIVVNAAGGFVHTVEGNAGNPPAVRACRYAAGGRTILGYGRPDWSLVPADKPPEGSGEIAGEEVDDMAYYKTLADVPEWYRPAVEKAVNAGALWGTGDGLNVSEDFCRTMAVLDRMGKLD